MAILTPSRPPRTARERAQAQGTLSLLNASQPLARACLAMGVAGLPGLNDTTGATA